jgi:hypothetical protein
MKTNKDGLTPEQLEPQADASQRVMPGYDFSLEDVVAEKASPVDMRRALQVADEFKKIGILFVPMPVLNKKDGDALCAESFKRMDILEQKAASGS